LQLNLKILLISAMSLYGLLSLFVGLLEFSMFVFDFVQLPLEFLEIIALITVFTNQTICLWP